MKFPVLAFKENDTGLFVYMNQKELEITSEYLLEQKKVFNEVNFIDSSGKIFRITTVKRIGWATCLFGYSLIRKGRLIKIKFDLQQIGQMEISHFKTLIVEKLKYNPNKKETEQQVLNSTAFTDIINFMR
jgi:hypothetical protein